MADVRQLLVVDSLSVSIGELASELPDVAIQAVDVDDLPVQLCRSTVHALLVPGDLARADPENIVHAVSGLFPSLPIVVVDPDGAGPDAADSESATVLAADSVATAAVVDTVRDALEAGSDSDAARPPSRPETLLAAMLEGFPAHIYAKDLDARHLLASDEMFAPGDLLGLTDMETLSGDECYDEANYIDDQRVIEEGEPILNTDEYADSPGLFLRTSKVPWWDASGDILGLVGITQDVTEYREQKERLRRQNRRLRKVALMTAHELRNELQIATGHLSQIDSDSEHLAAASTSVEHVAGIVDKIVSLATRNEREHETDTLWLSALVRDVWETVSTPESTLSIESDRRLVGDRDATQLLLELLVDNAVVHAGPGVTVDVGETESGFFVADDGPGIDFDPPRQVLQAAVTSADGESGFGLYIAQQIADEQGWRIAVSDSETGGARIDVVGVERP
ncbi:PAS domain-containing sensor histidine kinase [Halapricum desulfuricans]|uniref:histidine kinase n=1 Tax=Halapricum desulfuricans TaxID=2841257 RepID=A0A897MYW8_9EURY|nr:PAS domain-containing sensor histidine kinase [Halapricum desulfuricans]QSG05178.1 Signal transduction histidine kinase [Halapricum desulfuricans]